MNEFNEFVCEIFSAAGDIVIRSMMGGYLNVYTKELAFLAFKSNVYQVRMYSVFLFGHLSSYEEILIFMRDEVSKDDNWRVQEVLAKAFDEFCKQTGYEKSLPIIDEWLQNSNPNVRRAVT